MNQEALKVLESRRSCRAYKPEQITEEELQAVLKAGTYAPTVLIVLSDKSAPTYFYDGCCVMDNLLNAAEAVGLGSCWIHRAKEEFESAEGKAMLAKWGIEGDYEGIGHCVLGYWEGDKPEAAARKDNYVYYVR